MMHRRLPSGFVQTGSCGISNLTPSEAVQLGAVIGSLRGSNSTESMVAKLGGGAFGGDLMAKSIGSVSLYRDRGRFD